VKTSPGPHEKEREGRLTVGKLPGSEYSKKKATTHNVGQWNSERR